MIPEFGHLALIIALAFAMCLSTLPLFGIYLKNNTVMRYAWPLTYFMFIFTLISITILAYCFVLDDFSVKYIASHSNTQLPYYFKISAVWGGHEGSLLFWVFSLTCWAALVARFSKKIDRQFIAQVLSVMGMIAVGFIAFTLLTSNPFERLLPNFPLEGRDLNPLLQDVGLIFHPPLLYLGYVGFSVVFAFAISALISGKMDSTWAKWSRPWTISAWGFLTLGITLGSWWAYYELGWGGWWFWDPVENASFMPWLVGTALLHSLAVTEKRGIFINWTILLAIITFSLSLLGTFLVRSGVLTSVHSFASDPTRGAFILILLAIAVSGSLLLFAFKASNIQNVREYALFSRETTLLIANIILIIAAATVLLGTLYPLLIDALGMGKISVGPPYFNTVFVPIMALLCVFMGFGPLLRWKKTKLKALKNTIKLILLISLILGFLFPILYTGKFNFIVSLSMSLAFWILLTNIKALHAEKKRPLSLYGMFSAHIGIAFCIIGITLVSTYENEINVRIALNERVDISGYQIEFKGIKMIEGANYVAEQGLINVYKNNQLIASLHPQRRSYNTRGMGMTEAGIDAGLFRDIYVALGEPLESLNPKEQPWAIRISYKPFVRWIWLGGIFMALGALFSVLDKRYYRQKSLSCYKSLTTHNSVLISPQNKEITNE